LHSDEPLAQAALPTGVLSVTLASASGAAALAITGLEVPILLAIPLAATSNCTSPFYGPSCELKVACHYWDTAAQAYLTDGCETVAPPLGEDPSLLYCACTHLTDFAGILIPTNTDELAQASKTNINTFSAAQASAALSEIDAESIVANPIVYGLVFGMAGACALSLLLFGFRDYREEQQRQRRLKADESVKAAEVKRSNKASEALQVTLTLTLTLNPNPNLGGAPDADWGRFQEAAQDQRAGARRHLRA
jgi:hypothetical protein